jgi:hypothetical protein
MATSEPRFTCSCKADKENPELIDHGSRCKLIGLSKKDVIDFNNFAKDYPYQRCEKIRIHYNTSRRTSVLLTVPVSAPAPTPTLARASAGVSARAPTLTNPVKASNQKRTVNTAELTGTGTSPRGQSKIGGGGSRGSGMDSHSGSQSKAQNRDFVQGNEPQDDFGDILFNDNAMLVESTKSQPQPQPQPKARGAISAGGRGGDSDRFTGEEKMVVSPRGPLLKVPVESMENQAARDGLGLTTQTDVHASAENLQSFLMMDHAPLNGHLVEEPIDGHLDEAPLDGHQDEESLDATDNVLQLEKGGKNSVLGPEYYWRPLFGAT